MLKTVQEKINKRKYKKLFKKMSLFYKNNRYPSWGILLGLFLLIFGLIIYFSNRLQPNDNISFLPSINRAILQNRNPNFNVFFGNRREPEKQWARFEARAVKENPFEEKNGNFFERVVDFVRPTRTYGIEFSLEKVGGRDVSTSTQLVDLKELKNEDGTYVGVDKNVVLNPDVVDGVDIEYRIIEGRGLKEDIVIKSLHEYSKGCEDILECNLNEFVFDIGLDRGLEVRSAWYTYNGKSTKNYYFTDNRGNYVAHFLPGWAVDSKGTKTYDVDIKIVEEEEDLKIKVVVDNDWLFSEERVYPVRIDPTIVHDTELEFDEGVYINTEYMSGKGVGIKEIPTCTGGTIYEYNGYQIHAFTSDGTFSCDDKVVADVLVVAGGGGGGKRHGGGGGAGGLIFRENLSISDSSNTILVGSGGQGAGPGIAPTSAQNGQNSTAFGLVAIGGGGGGSYNADGGGTTPDILAGNSGGSGGGGATNSGYGGLGTPGQGNSGGTPDTASWPGAGGGGATEPGSPNSGTKGGNGGNGFNYSNIFGTTYGENGWFAGGGGGAAAGVSSADIGLGGMGGGADGSEGDIQGKNGLTNSGGGGGGARSTYGKANITGGNGGSGIVLIRIKPYSSGEYVSPTIDFETNSNIEAISWDSEGVNTGDGEIPYDDTGLVAQWNFNEVSGTTAVSGGSCGTDCNGTLNNFSNTSGQDVAIGSGWTHTHRRWGNGALMFDGGNDIVTVPDNSDLDPSEITLEAWIKPSAHQLGNFINKGDNSGYRFRVNNEGTIRFFDRGATNNITSQTTVPLNQWSHVVATGDSSGLKIYINGVLDASNSTAYGEPSTNYDLIFGRYSTSEYYAGILDEVRIYNRALSPEEILSNYNAGNIEFQYRTSNDGSTWSEWEGGSEEEIESFDNQYLYDTTDTGLVGYWAMDELTGSTVNDLSGNNNHGTANGTTIVDGVHGKGREFDGVGEGITFNAGTPLDTPSVYTITGWIHITGTNGSWPRWLSGHNGASFHNPDLAILSDGKIGYNHSELTTGWINTGQDINFNEWVYLSYIFNSNGWVHVYLNGNLIHSQQHTSGTFSSEYDFVVGNRYDYNGEAIDGLIDEVQVYNRALSSSEIHNKWIKGSTNPSTFRTSSIDNSVEGDRSLQVESGGNIDNNLVGYWKLDETGGTGAYLKDYSGNDNHGTPTGTTFEKNGKVRGARNFDGSNNTRITIGDISSFESSVFTIVAYVKRQGSCNFDHCSIFSKGSSDFEGYAFALIGEDPVLQIRINDGGSGFTQYLNGSTVLSDDSWYHVVAVVDSVSETFRLYLDGNLDAEGEFTETINYDSAEVKIGNGNDNNDIAFNGLIDEVSFYDTALTHEQIYESYRMGRDHYINKPLDSSIDLNNTTTIPFWIASDTLGTNLELVYGNNKYVNNQPDEHTVGLWRMEEDWGHAFDTSGNNNDGLVNPNSFLYTRYNNSCSAHPTTHEGLLACYDTSVLLHKSIQNTSESERNIADQYTSMYSTWMHVETPGTWTFAIDGDDAVEIEVNGTVVASWYGGHGFCECYDHNGTIILNEGWHKINIRHEEIAGGDGVVAHFIPPGGSSWSVLNASNLSGNATIHAYLLEDSGVQNSDYILNGIPRPARPSVNGKIGQARSFNGSSDLIEIGHDETLNFGGAITLGAWVKFSDYGGKDYETIISKENVYALYMDYDGRSGVPQQFNFDIWQWRFVSSVGTWQSGEWYHVMATFNESDGAQKIYVNGELNNQVNRAGETLHQNTNNIKIGELTSIGHSYFNGLIDDVRIDNIARTPEEIKQMYELGRRSHPITINFKAELQSSNLITDSNDLSFDIDETPYGTTNTIENIDRGEKIIIKENYNGTEYIAQGNIATINKSTGAVTVEQWDSGSTFPSVGFSVNATVFKWQREYVDTRYLLPEDKDNISQLTFRKTTSEPATFWIDDMKKAKYLTDSSGDTFERVESVQYVQYRSIFTTWDSSISSDFYLTSASVQYNRPPLAPTQLLTQNETSPVGYATSLNTGGHIYLTSQVHNADLSISEPDPENSNIRTVSGYAWSEDLGWIRFTEDMGNDGVFIDYNTGAVTGSAYVMNTGALVDFTNYNSNTVLNTQTGIFSGYAWSEDLGWIDFNNVYIQEISPITGVSIQNPVFSAIFNDHDITDTGEEYYIQVNTQDDFEGTMMWDSGWQNMISTPVGERSPNITYDGDPLDYEGTTYYWRIKFKDNYEAESPWSETAQFTMNDNPTAPTDLLTEGETNPTDISIQDPKFSAIFNDPDTGDTAEYYQIQVNTQSNFGGTTMWDSGKSSVTSTTEGTRSPDITYDGDPLEESTTYYWRIKFWDSVDNEGAWSEEAAHFTMHTPNVAPTAPTNLLTVDETNPTGISLSITPYFSAIFNDPDEEDTAEYYRIQVNTNSSFTGNMMWDSNKASMPSVPQGTRSHDIDYGDMQLQPDTTYYWRIKFWDSIDNEGVWSETANFSMAEYDPEAPTSLLVENQTNPQKMGNETPRFSAIFNHQFSEEVSEYYQIQVNTTSNFEGTTMWDSTKTQMNTVAQGERTEDIEYDGNPLNMEETTYYWRIRFWDQLDKPSPWSQTANFKTTPPYVRLDGLQLDGITID